MAGIKQTEANTVLDNMLTGSLYVALFTSAPTSTTAGTEVSGGSYARQSVSFASASAGSKASSGAITFPSATASWGTIVAWAIVTASSGGAQKTFRTITSIVVNNGDQVVIPSGAIIHTLT